MTVNYGVFPGELRGTKSIATFHERFDPQTLNLWPFSGRYRAQDDVPVIVIACVPRFTRHHVPLYLLSANNVGWLFNTDLSFLHETVI
jgi:hypothetical protein